MQEPKVRLYALYDRIYRRDLQGRAHRYLNMFPSRKAMARDTIRNLTRPKRCFMPVVEMISEINVWQRGWTNYFKSDYPRVAFRVIHSYIVAKLTTHLQRRSQRAYRPPAGKSFYAHVAVNQSDSALAKTLQKTGAEEARLTETKKKADGEGFEPTDALRRLRFSRPVH